MYYKVGIRFTYLESSIAKRVLSQELRGTCGAGGGFSVARGITSRGRGSPGHDVREGEGMIILLSTDK